MKKIVFAALIAVVAFAFSSCNVLGTKSTVNVKVENLLEQAVASQEVYMFKSSTWAKEEYRQPITADKLRSTSKDGVAVFELNVIDLDFIDEQSTLYFAIFSSEMNDEFEYELIDHKSVSIKKGESKDLTLNTHSL